MDFFFQGCHTLDVSHACNNAEMWEGALYTLAQDENVQGVVVESSALTRARFKRLVTVLRARKKRVGALTCSEFSPDACAFLFEQVAKLLIPRLCLRQNTADTTCIFFLGIQLQNYTHVTHLDLSRNAICSSTLPTLVRGLQRHKNLQCLALSQNPLGDTGLLYLAPLLAKPLKLRRLYLADTKAASVGAAQMAECVCQHPSLELLDLSENPLLGAVGWSTLALALERNASLRVLSLAFTSPRLRNIDQMAKSLKENYTLRVLEYTLEGDAAQKASVAEEQISNYLARNQAAFQGTNARAV